MSPARRFAAGCVASPHHIASAAGVDVLADGGNALDAAIATNLVLGVVAPYACGYGGDLFAIVWDGAVHAYAGAGRAPAAATAEATRAACGSDQMPAFGPVSVTVPGAVRGWFDLLDRFGSRGFPALAAAALRLAGEGFEVSERAAPSFARAASMYAAETEWQRVYAGVRAGATLRQPGLARTIGALSEHGPDVYYRGEIADAIAGHLAGRGALMTADDLAAHTGEWVTPLRARYRDVDVLEMPPPSQGVAALEAMRIADGFPARDEHVLIESIKLALADRDAHVTDRPWMRVAPEEILSDPWIDARRSSIDLARASAHPAARTPLGGTAFMCAADRDGMMVSLIQSNWRGFGSGVTVPGWGINLHNRGLDFSLDPQHPNAIEPGKRSMHTLIPAMAFRDGHPWLAFGTMGGHGQAQTHLQVLTRMVDDGADPQDAIDAPRWYVSPADGRVTMEERFAQAVEEELRARGHAIARTGAFDSLMGHAQAVQAVPGGYACASDPRSEGAALGLGAL